MRGFLEAFFLLFVICWSAGAQDHTPDKTLPLPVKVPFSYRGQTPKVAGDTHQALEQTRKSLVEQLNGQKVLITRSLKGEQIAWAKSCELLKAEIEPLRAWQAKTDFLDPRSSEEVAKSAKCTFSKEHGLYWMDVSSYLPIFSTQCLGFQFECTGPNCMNAALLGGGTCKAVRYSSSEELLSVLDSASCKRVEDPTKLQPGDIVSVGEGNPMKPVHAFVYVSENLAFEKPGGTSQHLHRFLSPSNILKNWGVPEKCFVHRGTDEECPHRWAQAHHCETSEMISTRLSENETPALDAVRRQADEYELEKFDDYFFKTYEAPAISAQELHRRVEALLKNDVLSAMPRDLLKATPEQDRAGLIEKWNIQLQRIRSMLTQTEILSQTANETRELERYQKVPLRTAVESVFEKLETRTDGAATYPFINALASRMQLEPVAVFSFMQKELPSLLKSYDAMDASQTEQSGSRSWKVRKSFEVAAEVAEQLAEDPAVRSQIQRLRSNTPQAPVKKARPIP